MTEEDLIKYGIDVQGIGLSGDSYELDDGLDEYSDLSRLTGAFEGGIYDVLYGCDTLEDHEQRCRDIAALEKMSATVKHPYLNAPTGSIREFIYTSCEHPDGCLVSKSRLFQIKEKIKSNLRKAKEKEDTFVTLHSKIYMMASYLLYTMHEIVADDELSRKVITALYEDNQLVISELENDFIARIYVRVFSELTDQIRVGLDYTSYEKNNLIAKHKKISKRLGISEDSSDLFKCVYVLNERINSLDETLDYFDLNRVFTDYTGRSLSQPEARFVIDLLFDKPKANKFEFLSEIEKYSDLLNDKPENRILLENSLKGLGNNLRHQENDSLSVPEGYRRLVKYFDGEMTLITGDIDNDISRARSGSLLKSIREFLEGREKLSSFSDWNDLSLVSYILRHMKAQTELPKYYDDYSKLKSVHRKLLSRLTTGNTGMQVTKCPSAHNDLTYGALITYLDKKVPLVLNFGEPKGLLSAVEKKLRGSEKIDDTFRCRIGIPYELEMSDNPNDISEFCYAATDLILGKLGAHADNIRSIKASLLTADPHLNEFSKSIRTFKYIVDVVIDGEIVPIEIMMILFYPDDHSSYKERQCESTRNKLGLLPAKHEIMKAVEYLDWKYSSSNPIDVTDVRRLNSIILTLVNEYSSEIDNEVNDIFEDQSFCDRLEQLCLKFKNSMDRQYLSAIVRKLVFHKSNNERRRLILDINMLSQKYIDKGNFEDEDIELIKQVVLEISNYSILGIAEITRLQTAIVMLELEGEIESSSLRADLFHLLNLAVVGKANLSQ